MTRSTIAIQTSVSVGTIKGVRCLFIFGEKWSIFSGIEKVRFYEMAGRRDGSLAHIS